MALWGSAPVLGFVEVEVNVKVRVEVEVEVEVGFQSKFQIRPAWVNFDCIDGSQVKFSTAGID